MKRNSEFFRRRAYHDQRGQVVPLVALSMAAIMAMAALVFDVGLTYCIYSELQISTQAAALAGGEAMAAAGATVASVTSAVQTYSAVSGNKNAYSNLPGISLVAPYNPKLYCSTNLNNLGYQCVGPGGTNALTVEQSVIVPMAFAKLFGMSSLTLTSTATASMRGASQGPFNVVMLMDSTSSMNQIQSYADCSTSAISCGLSGIQVLLQNLSPCSSTLTSCGSVTQVTGPPAYGYVGNSVDRVSLLTFPPVLASTATDDFNCGSTTPTIVPYDATTPTKFPATDTYQIVGFSSDYKASDSTSTLNTSSNLVKAVNGKSGCTGLQAIGGDGTYYAQAVAQATAYLVAEQALFPGSKNVLIILSDGDSNSTCSQSSGGVCTSGPMTGASTTVATGAYPPASTLQQCHQAIAAAQSAWNAGITVYAVNFGAEASGCTTDTSPTISPCQTMVQMATAPGATSTTTYFSDDPTGGSSSCASSARPTTSLNQIFQVIAGDLSVARLTPSNWP